jgi:ferredoxin
MADRNDKNTDNAPGPFYVDTSCIDCDMCRETAPQIFRRNEDIAFSIAYHQPVTAEETQAAIAAMNGCPTDSIGNDG